MSPLAVPPNWDSTLGFVRIPEGFDFTDPELYAARVPLEEFAELRRTAPVWWNAKPLERGGFADEGCWVVSRHADVKEVSRDAETFSSWENTCIIRYPDGTPRAEIELPRLLLMNMDAPQHTKLRGIISRGFTPKAISALENALRARAEHIVRAALTDGTGDFVADVASELPLQAIAELIGVPPEDRGKIFDWSNQMIAYDDPECEHDPKVAATELLGYSWNLAEDRRGCPRDDIVTKLVQADVDGAGLGSDEFGFFVVLLAVAGHETTRNAITHGMKAFFDHPDQWELFKAERPKTAADEIVRWATPVVAFQRTALRDTEVGGVEIKRGQRVGLCYSSANFDEDVFDRPDRFDITRSPNPHLGFGGGGPHYCVGASLARLEIDLMFNAIADHLPEIRPVGAPRRLRSGWINGVKEYRVQYR